MNPYVEIARCILGKLFCITITCNTWENRSNAYQPGVLKKMIRHTPKRKLHLERKVSTDC